MDKVRFGVIGYGNMGSQHIRYLANGEIPGAVLGGLLIGLIETFWSAYFSVQYKDVAAFSILALTLIFLPTGLLGRTEVEKV